MNVLILISLVSGLLGLVLLVRTLHSLRHRRFVRAGGSGLACCASAAVFTAGLMLLLGLYSYGRLVEEIQVSSIEFRRIAPQEFEARLMIDGERDRLFTLHGDEWQMDARILTWKPPLTILGLDPLFMLDRLNGRYADIDSERTAARSVHSLAPETPLDLWRTARRFPMLTPGVDAYYGTATYVPMSDGARFDVWLSRDAIIARPANERARASVEGWSLVPQRPQ